MNGFEAVIKILEATQTTAESHVYGGDPVQLQPGNTVKISTTEGAQTHYDVGKLLGLNVQSVCILNDKNLRLHFPRWNFDIRKIDSSLGELLKSPSVSSGANAQPLRLIYHPMSPYSRKVYMVAVEPGIAHLIALDKVVVAPIPYPGWSDDNEKVAEYNPVAKIPTLVLETSGDGIHDSREIVEYLVEISQTRPIEITDVRLKWRLKSLGSLANAILDAHVLIVYENKIRAENGIRFARWVEGQQLKINCALNQLEIEAERGIFPTKELDQIATVDEVGLAAALSFTDTMQHEWRSGRPKLARWYSDWVLRPSFKRTRPEVDWVTG